MNQTKQALINAGPKSGLIDRPVADWAKIASYAAGLAFSAACWAGLALLLANLSKSWFQKEDSPL